jgi:UDP-N-acetylmuramoyl-L-alanyl-D-glutamate--2,6-diaminopimelate ligase
MDGDRARHVDLPAGDPDIRGLTADSRLVEPGFLFAALPGVTTDGRRFIQDALERGAAALLTDELSALGAYPPSVQVIVDANPRRRLALMASHFYAPQPATIAAVTGTNGKTSVTVFLRQIWQRLGLKAASLGTIGIHGTGIDRPGSLTTPDPVTLHRDLRDLAAAGINHVALEASSHGLAQFRLDGLQLSAAAFTNLTRDHLDYHVDMDAYFAAKTRLFTEVLPAGGTAVLNTDTAEGEQLAVLCRQRGRRVLTFGRAPIADLRLIAAKPQDTGQAISIAVLGERRDLVLPLVGAFQVSNALAALGLAIAAGAPAGAALDSLAHLVGAPGRLEHVASHPNGAPVIVDYAHTPDALDTVLTALRPHTRGRLVVVFGCGGDRDPGKRPQMGAIAQRLADIAIVTDDNPRSENPVAIRRAILAACPQATEIGDRASAIRTAVGLLNAEDVLVLAGKGHEQGQIVGAHTLPFDDAAVARAAIAELQSARP